MKKGEAVVEYAIKYWYILALLAITCGFLSYYVFFHSAGEKGGCYGIFTIMPEDWMYNEDGSLQFRMENKAGKTVNITSLSLTADNLTIDKSFNLVIGIDEKTSNIIAFGLKEGKFGDTISVRLKIKYLIPGEISGENTFFCRLKGKIGV